MTESTAPTNTGSVDFVVGDHTFQTWYKILGDIHTSKKRPIVMLHGGPGFNHVPHEKLFTDAGIPVVFYDQIGLRQYPESPPEFWTVDLFNDELDNLLRHLGIRDNFDLYGHSWGGIFGSDYASNRMHPGLKRLILANTFCSSKLYIQGAQYWRDQLPNGLGDVLRKHEVDGTTDSPEYKETLAIYRNIHLCTLTPWPKKLVHSMANGKDNRHPEFSMSKRLKDWSVIDVLHNVTCPTLLISAPQDEMWEPAVRPFFLNIPKCKWVELQNSSHVPMYEEPDNYFKILINFLSSVEA
ncbi:Alpha/Beta hydrolase protein [Armillaria novae-zelandiae]|uniref:Alpha/Beta hydrolase protein n=1 Tax=Armillaria novae-zelandiae TaxID=153914 RepID=A0AA39NYF5_9AGAR|nr:Alpha/Beta hydrolase protein [Armillaria novae-zelandiae]